MSTSSGSRSPSVERIDKFGRVIPRKRSRTHSRSRSRSRSRGRFQHASRYRRPFRHLSRSRSRSRDRGRGRVRSRDRSRERSRDRPARPERPPIPIKNRTNIEDPKYLNARIFIGSLPVDKVSKEELEATFKEYGNVLGISIHDRGYGFVQFELEEEARKAVQVENGSLLKGSVLDVKMAAEGRRGGPLERNRASRTRGSPPPFDRDSDRGSFGSRDGRAPPPAGRDRSPVRSDPYEDRYRDPYPRREPPPPPARESLERTSGDLGVPRDLPPPSRRDERDPYYADPYRRPPPPADDPYFDRYRDDPYRYRRDPYADPLRDRDPYYREPFDAPGLPPPPPKKLPADCHVIMLTPQLREYAEQIEARLRQSTILCDILSIPEDLSVPQMIEEASMKKCLFAIIVNSQNMAHRSLTLNILHGTPQEHRNMPFEDAMNLMARSFEGFMAAQKEKATAAAPAPTGAAPAARAPPPFVPPAADIAYLLNLLADNRQLTIEELEKVIGYLKERRNKLLTAEGRAVPPEEAARPGVAPAATAGTTATSNYLQQEQQELQAKILSILNGSAPSAVAQPSSAIVAQRPGPPPGKPQGSNALINFDNPNVQKALDNLIQSGPNLLKSIPSSSPQTSRLQTQQPAGMMARSNNHPQTTLQTASQQQLGGYGAPTHYQAQTQQSHMGGMPQRPTGYPGAAAQSYPGAAAQGRAPQQGMRPRMM